MKWNYHGRVRRKAANAYVDATGNTKKPICPRCYDKGLNRDLVPYLNDQGIRDDNFKRCPMCGDGIPTKEMKYETELEDFVDVESANKPSNFVVVESRRSVRTSRNNYEEQYQVPKYPNGREDVELRTLLERGVLLEINDQMPNDTIENSE